MQVFLSLGKWPFQRWRGGIELPAVSQPYRMMVAKTIMKARRANHVDRTKNDVP